MKMKLVAHIRPERDAPESDAPSTGRRFRY